LGGCTTRPPSPNATTPIFIVRGLFFTKSNANDFAASILVGSTSSAAMLAETSKVNMTTPSSRGTGSVTSGRAAATSRTTSPSKKSTAGR
jgi:hypothetical protein